MKPINLNAVNSPQQTKSSRLESTRPRAADLAKPATAGQGSDEVSVTSLDVHIGRLVERARSQDTVRHERVDALRQTVQAGTYQVSSSDIADAILRDEV